MINRAKRKFHIFNNLKMKKISPCLNLNFLDITNWNDAIF